MIECALCMDIGTTSLKAGLITATGEVVSFFNYRFLFPKSKFVSKKWIKGFHYCLKKMKSQCKKNELQIKINGVSISGNGPTIVCENGFTISWNRKYKIGSKIIGTSLFLPKIIELKENFSKQYSKSQLIFSGPEYLIYKITGKAVTILPEQRFQSAYWTSSLLKAENLPENKFPPFIKIGEKISEIKSDFINEFCFNENQTASIPVFSAGPDFIAALIGTNTLEEGKICDRAGSSEGINFCISKNIHFENLRTLPSVIDGLWNVSVLIPDSSKISRNKRIHKLSESYDLLKKFAEKNGLAFPSKIVSTGGQTKNKKWMEKKSKELKLRFVVSNCYDSELLGNAAVAWFGTKRYKSLKEAASYIFKEDIIYENF